MDIQWATEMRNPVGLYDSIQGDGIIQRKVRKVVKTDLRNWVERTGAGISDTIQRVRTNIRGEQVEPSRRREKERKDSEIVDLSKNATQFPEEIPNSV
jgi:hypothetical protein